MNLGSQDRLVGSLDYIDTLLKQATREARNALENNPGEPMDQAESARLVRRVIEMQELSVRLLRRSGDRSLWPEREIARSPLLGKIPPMPALPEPIAHVGGPEGERYSRTQVYDVAHQCWNTLFEFFTGTKHHGTHI